MQIHELANTKLKQWLDEVIHLCQPDAVHICDGSKQEYELLAERLVKKGTFTRLNPGKRPNSFLARSTPDDVARVEERTFICSLKQEDAGPTNNWRDPQEMKATLKQLFKGCMRGRTLYAIPFSMGPIDSPLARIGVEITDSAYVVCNMHLMTHVGKRVLDKLADNDFVPCLHSVGQPLAEGQKSAVWPCNPENKYIVHFPEEQSIASFGSGYGGNALLGKKSFALRIASVIARQEGWLAEHMLILGITNPEGQKKYIAAAFPSACGKTNLAMMQPSLPGWKIETVGDDIAWMKFGADGQLYAINPEAGFFGVAPGTSSKSNPNAIKTIASNTIFTNVALTDEGDIWWEGLSCDKPAHLIDWLGKDWTPNSTQKAAHPNSRFTVSAAQCPCIDPSWQEPSGVPISAILFGGRRSKVTPLVMEAFDWNHGVFLGASVSSEMTAAAAGELGKLRHDPFAMLPFCGYNMGEYFAHWIATGKGSKKLPRVYAVNWFRKNAKGEWIWPGYSENSRVLKWIFERTEDKVQADIAPFGLIPKIEDLDLTNLSLNPKDVEELFAVDLPGWQQEVESLSAYFQIFGKKFPVELQDQLQQLQKRLKE